MIRKLVEMEIISAVEGNYGIRLFIKDHLKLEEIPQEQTESKLDDMLRPMVRTSLRATIIILALVQVATILSDKPMTSVIAGLGVGGLAIGLAGEPVGQSFGKFIN